MRTIVGVLRGGPSREYEASLATGAAVLEHLDREKYEPRDIFISKNGQWHAHGLEVAPEKALKGVDVAFNALHGDYGEDGRVQRELDAFGVPYTGSSAFASALAYNKHHAKDAARKLGIKTPHSLVLEPAEEGEIDALARRLWRSFPQPSIIKPSAAGSRMGVTVVEHYHALLEAFREAAARSPKVLIEEYIPGREVSVGVIDNFRNEDTYALIPTPNTFSHQEKDALAALAKQMHRGLGLMHYSDSDFVVSKRGIYYLETNSHPKLHGGSKLVSALQLVGASVSHFLDHVISLARTRRA